MIRFLLATFLLLLSSRVSAQVTTTVVVNGATVVQVVGTDAGGNPFTQAITTLPPGGVVPTTATPTPTPVPGAGTTAPTSPPATTAPTTSPTSTPSTTTTPLTTVNTDTGIQGPVGAPPTTTVGTPGVPIPYVYTTVIGGVTTLIQDIFTPTSPATVSVTPTGSGTILDYSDWLTMNGLSPTNTALTGAGSSSRPAVLGLVLPAVTGVYWMLSSL